ncbi:MAG: hypothetical protein KBT87_06295 [Gammaproteobacteria bacterium]|nr:hypothetical protein [Gammaproteobacteria bacterium]MBQ0774265.1 hypothetical protein [Gammaproteobacteria bacterium]
MTRLIKVSPSFIDEIPHKPHTKIANSIIEVVNNNDNVCIGLRGGWGQGKSTIAKIIESESREDISVKCFNIWSASDDNIYQSFCESLAEGSEEKEKILKDIVTQNLRTETRNDFRPSRPQVVFLFALMILPFSLDFFMNVMFEGDIMIRKSPGLATISLIISTLVLGYFLIRLILFVLNRFIESQEEGHEEISALWGKAAAHIEMREESIGVSWRQKSSSVLKKVCSNKTLIIVDDIDRLSGGKLDAAWEFLSDLRSLQEELLVSDININILVSYSKDLKSLPDHFKRMPLKIFDVVYSVPDISMQDAYSYFMRIGRKIFPNLANNESLYQDIIFRAWAFGAPSLRDVVQLVNAISSVHGLHGDSVDFFNCFLYCLHLKSIEVAIDNKADVMGVFPEALVKSNHFNVDSQYQLIYLTDGGTARAIHRLVDRLDLISRDPRDWKKTIGNDDSDALHISYKIFYSRIANDDGYSHYRAAFFLSGLFSYKSPFFKSSSFELEDINQIISYLRGSSVEILYDQDALKYVLSNFSNNKEGVIDLFNLFNEIHFGSVSDPQYVLDFYLAIRSAVFSIFSSDVRGSVEPIKIKSTSGWGVYLVDGISSGSLDVSVLDVFPGEVVPDLLVFPDFYGGFLRAEKFIPVLRIFSYAASNHPSFLTKLKEKFGDFSHLSDADDGLFLLCVSAYILTDPRWFRSKAPNVLPAQNFKRHLDHLIGLKSTMEQPFVAAAIALLLIAQTNRSTSLRESFGHFEAIFSDERLFGDNRYRDHGFKMTIKKFLVDLKSSGMDVNSRAYQAIDKFM